MAHWYDQQAAHCTEQWPAVKDSPPHVFESEDAWVTRLRARAGAVVRTHEGVSATSSEVVQLVGAAHLSLVAPRPRTEAAGRATGRAATGA